MLYTIGYEKAQLPHFIGTLQNCGIDILIDIRDRAQSRRKGFSKTALSDELALYGIDYIHMRELGDPKEGRDAARSGRINDFLRIYSEVLQKPCAVQALDRIAHFAQSNSVCLLCYERCHRDCHRSLVADQLVCRLRDKPRHIGVREIEPERQMRNCCKSSTAS